MAKLVEGIIVNYDPANKKRLKPIVQSVANDFDISGNVTLNGAEVDNISIVGSVVSVDTSSEPAIVSISGSEPFKVNNASVKGASVVGSGFDLSFDNGTAIVSIETAEAGLVTVNGFEAPAISIGGGGAQVNYDSTNKTIIINIPTTLENPKLSIQPIYLIPNQTKTVTVSSISDGIISTIPNPKIAVQQISANEFNLTAQELGDTNLGFRQDQSSDYYGVAKNALVSVVESEPKIVYLTFEETTDLYKNSGSDDVEILQNSDTAVLYASKLQNAYTPQTSLSDWDAAYSTGGSICFDENFFIGDKPFTIDFFTVTNRFASDSYLACGHFGIFTGQVEVFRINAYRQFYSFATLMDTKDSEMFQMMNHQEHIAITYDGDALRFFVDGKLSLTYQCEVLRDNVKLSWNPYYSCVPMIAQFRIIDGICAWQNDFTPHTEPY